jgi:hypothetical protein
VSRLQVNKVIDVHTFPDLFLSLSALGSQSPVIGDSDASALCTAITLRRAAHYWWLMILFAIAFMLGGARLRWAVCFSDPTNEKADSYCNKTNQNESPSTTRSPQPSRAGLYTSVDTDLSESLVQQALSVGKDVGKEGGRGQGSVPAAPARGLVSRIPTNQADL